MEQKEIYRYALFGALQAYSSAFDQMMRYPNDKESEDKYKRVSDDVEKLKELFAFVNGREKGT